MDEKQYWWESPKNECHKELFSIITYLVRHQGHIKENNIRNMRLYGGLNVLGLSGFSYAQSSSINPPYDRLGLNIVKSMVDTITNKIAKNKPRPMFLTSGGDYKLQQKAKMLTKFVDGQFYASDVYKTSPKVFRDSAILGTGFAKIYRSGKKVKLERVFPAEILVDEQEGMFGTIRNMYQSKAMPRELVMKIWPEYKDKIKYAQHAESWLPAHKNLTDFVNVVEAWHLPSDEGAKDGRHVICIDNETFLDEKWEKDYFPFAKFNFSDRMIGYQGEGLAEQLTGLQVEINKTLKTIQQTFQTVAVPRMYLEMGSKIVKSQLNNEVGSLVWYQGTKPIIEGASGLDSQIFMYLENLYRKAYEISGVSQLSANSSKPAGLNSGKALREFNDIESDRLMLLGQEWEFYHLEVARQMIDLAKEIDQEEDGGFQVFAKSGNSLEIIRWKDINLEQDQYQMQNYPTNFLSQTPAGRLQDVSDLVQAGFVDKANAMKLLNFPDLEAFERIENAPMDDLQRVKDEIVEKGEYSSPEPYQNLQMGIPYFQRAYLASKSMNVSEDKLEMLLRWIQEAQAQLDLAAQSMSPQMPQQAPIAKGEALPVSDLMQFGQHPGGMA